MSTIMIVGTIGLALGASVAGLIVGLFALTALHERDEALREKDDENEALCIRVQELTFRAQYLRGELDTANAIIRANAEEQKLAA